MKRLAVPAAFALILGAACSGSEKEHPGGEIPTEESSHEVPADPCSILTQDFISDHFKLEGQELRIEPGRSSTTLNCKASWQKADSEERTKQLPKMLEEYMAARSRGEKPKMPMIKIENMLYLTFYGKPFESPERADAAFRTMIGNLREGITAEAEVGGEKKKATFRATYDSKVEGVGDQAAWSSMLSQLSVQQGRTIFHIAVDVSDSDDENREKAADLATQISNGI